MSREIAYLRTVSVSQDTASTDSKTLVARACGNTGNMFFESALDAQLPDSVERLWSFDTIPQDLDILVLSMSNFLSKYTNFEKFAEILERKKVNQVVMIGCGAQAYDYSESYELTPGTRRFVDILRERSVTIGARGEYTAEFLNKLGVTNVDIIGCPSLYWPMERGWPRFVPNCFENHAYGMHCTPSGFYRDKVKALFSYAYSHNMYYLMQTEVGYLEQGGDLHRDIFYYMGNNTAAIAVGEHFKKFGRIFYSVSDWVSFVSKLRFVLGCRFHGNVASLLAGRPCLTFVFDTRTRELVEFFNLPYMLFEDFDESLPISYYEERADFSGFHALYGCRLLKYKDFLDKNGLPNLIGKMYYDAVPGLSTLPSTHRQTVERVVRDSIRGGLNLSTFKNMVSSRIAIGRSLDDRLSAERGEDR